MKKPLFLHLFVLLIAIRMPAQKISGHWYGIMEVQNNQVPFELTVSENNNHFTGVYNVKGEFIRLFEMPIDTLLFYKDTVTFKIKLPVSVFTYKGAYDEKHNKINGFLNGTKGNPLTLDLNRSPLLLKPDTTDESKGREKIIFTRQDTLRGSITKERSWWDLTYYHLDIKVNPADSSIQGSVAIHYKILDEQKVMQIDLQPPLEIKKAIQNGRELKYTRDENVYYIRLEEIQKPGDNKQVTVYYGGKPRVAKHPPWDGGITWKKDANGLPFIASSCQGIGASIWWPCKDHMYDEPDSMLISVNVPGNLMDVSNGRLRSVNDLQDGTKTFHWFVSNPINNYGVNINIGDYAHFSDKYKGEKGLLDCDYYVLRTNLEKAKIHFKEAERMLKAFEHWFGPYPFYEDSYKLVEAPYLGMEHQSSVTYGNGYQNGYLGRDLSGSGWGMKFDYIIVHESGHEWFANNITYKDIADMWIHEGFTSYSEVLFVEYWYGIKAGNEYCLGLRKNIHNNTPIIGKYNVNNEGSGDMYPKSANMLHTLRQIIKDDEKWKSMLRGLNSTFYHQTVTTKQIENYLSDKAGRNLGPFFDQYLRDIRIPTLEYYFQDHNLVYRWINCVPAFDLPLKVYLNGKEKWLEPTSHWTQQYYASENPVLELDPNFYVGSINNTSKQEH